MAAGLHRVRYVGSLLLTLAGALPNVSASDDSHGASPLTTVAVEGTVTYTGPLLEPIPVPEAGTVRHPIEVDPKTKGLKDAVVWLEGVPARKGPTAGHGGEPTTRMDQQNYAFVPHVLAVEAGREVEFLNSDPANHGVTATSLEPRNAFNVVTPPGKGFKHRFVAVRRPVAIGCPLHGAMAAWVFVFEHPYHAVTDEDGSFRLPPVPPGRYTLHVRHQDGGMSKHEELDATGGEPPRLHIEFHEHDLKARGVKKS